MPSSFEDDANNEQLVHGAVETAINEFTGDLHGTNELNFPENFPTDAPQPSAEEQHYEESQEGQLHEHEQYQQLPPQPADDLPEEELYGEAHMSTSAPSEKKSKKQKAHVNSGRWTEAEHLAFIQGVEQHGKDCTKIAAMIPSRTTLQVRTHAQKYFQKLEKGTPADEVLADNNVHQPPPHGEGITSPVAAQTLLGMSQLSNSTHEELEEFQEQRGTKRKLKMGSKSAKSHDQCQYKDCKGLVHKGTQACLKHQPMLCSYPYCADFVEVDHRFSQKRELCRIHYMELTNRSRSMFPTRADRP